MAKGSTVDGDEATTDPEATVFRYTPRPPIDDRKAFDLLCRSDKLIAGVQTVSEGGETNLHSHRHLDGFWFVLKGRARFYTTEDEVVAELGPMEGVLVPRNFPYWFERVGEDDLHLLQVEATDRTIDEAISGSGDRVDYAPPNGDLSDRRDDFLNVLTPTQDSSSD